MKNIIVLCMSLLLRYLRDNLQYWVDRDIFVISRIAKFIIDLSLKRFQYLFVLGVIIFCLPVEIYILSEHPECKMIHQPDEPNEYIELLRSDECRIILPILKSSTCTTFIFSVAVIQMLISPIKPDIHSSKKQMQALTPRYNPKLMRQRQ